MWKRPKKEPVLYILAQCRSMSSTQFAIVASPEEASDILTYIEGKLSPFFDMKGKGISISIRNPSNKREALAKSKLWRVTDEFKAIETIQKSFQ